MLTQQKELLEILAIINRSKTIVYGVGKAIGGEGVGLWAADNTQMFYPETVDAATLVSAMLTVQDEIARTCQIKKCCACLALAQPALAEIRCRAARYSASSRSTSSAVDGRSSMLPTP
ncbi:MAG: hypothetical protein ABI547_07645 [Betaproteobacteria bacterium]